MAFGIDDALALFSAFAPFILGRGGGGNEVSPELPPEIKELLENQLRTSNRAEALVDPANASALGFPQGVPEGVPLRAAANQLAFSLLPNFVRPGNSLFPGTAPDFQRFEQTPGGDNFRTFEFNQGEVVRGSSQFLPGSSGAITAPRDERLKDGPNSGVNFLRDEFPDITLEQIIALLNGEVPTDLPPNRER
jgi:hypothetical protein